MLLVSPRCQRQGPAGRRVVARVVGMFPRGGARDLVSGAQQQRVRWLAPRPDPGSRIPCLADQVRIYMARQGPALLRYRRRAPVEQVADTAHRKGCVMSALGHERRHMQGHRIVLVPPSIGGPLDTPMLHDMSREGLVLRRHTKPRGIQLGHALVFHMLPLPISKHAFYRGHSHTCRRGWRRQRLIRHVPRMRRRLLLLLPVHIALLSMHAPSALKRAYLVHDSHTCTARYVHRRRQANERGRRVEDDASLLMTQHYIVSSRTPGSDALAGRGGAGSSSSSAPSSSSS